MRIAAESHIWTLNGDGQLIPVWQNHDGTSTPVDLCLNAAKGAIALTGKPSSLPSGWQQVVCFVLSSFECILSIFFFRNSSLLSKLLIS